MEYVKKNSLGVLKKCEDAEASHVMQTVGEYKQILEDLTEKVLVDIGCLHYVPPEDNGIYTYVDDGNVLYCWRCSADYKSGYWCVIIYTTKPLVVPVERRYRTIRRKQNRK